MRESLALFLKVVSIADTSVSITPGRDISFCNRSNERTNERTDEEVAGAGEGQKTQSNAQIMKKIVPSCAATYDRYRGIIHGENTRGREQWEPSRPAETRTLAERRSTFDLCTRKVERVKKQAILCVVETKTIPQHSMSQ